MGRDQYGSDAGQFEWVNAWAALRAEPAPAKAPVPMPSRPIVMPRLMPMEVPDDQLMRDVAEIERVRDVLAAVPVAGAEPRRRMQAFTVAPARTSDPVPVMVGGVLALVMLTVFGAAAAMTRIAR